MAKRAPKKAARKRVAKQKAPIKKSGGKLATKSTAVNQKAHWTAYKDLQKRVDQAWAQLKNNVKKKASPQVLLRDRNHLLLLLGECNYMARECMRLAAKKKKR